VKAHHFLEMNARMLAAYSNAVAKTCQKYGLNRTSFDILVFIRNHPHENTARNIVEKRGIKKAMASVAIDQLCRMGYLNRTADADDRRIQRLELTAQSTEITSLGQRLQDAFQERMFADFTDKQRAEYLDASEKLLTALNEMEEEEFL